MTKFLIVWPSSLAAQQKCGPFDCRSYDSIVQYLQERFGEEVIWTGQISQGWSATIFAAPDGESWTSIITAPNDRTCLMGAGVR